MSDLPGTGSIRYYLEGVARRQQREKMLQDYQLTLQEQELKAKQLQNTFDIAKEAEKGRNERAELKAEIDKQKIDIDKANTRLAALDKFREVSQALSAGDLEVVNPKEQIFKEDGITPNYANLRPTPQGTKRMWDVLQKGDEARAVESAKFPYASALQTQKDNAALTKQNDQQAATAEQNALNRDAMLERAKLGLSIRSNLKKDEKDALVNATADNLSPDAMTGNMTMEDFNRTMTGDSKALIQNELKRRGITLVHNEQRDSLNLLPLAQNFHAKLVRLNEIINKSSDPRLAEVDPEYRRLKAEVQQDLDAWGRAVKGFKGMITERDTQRLEGGLPKSWPGGLASITSSASDIKKANQQRVEAVEDFIQEKFDLITKGMTPNQIEAVRQRYNIYSPSERQLKKRKTKESELKSKQNKAEGPDWEDK